jgi:4-amino-4-deoxy-L-arabinose transferase-like glycosyltransferase
MKSPWLWGIVAVGLALRLGLMAAAWEHPGGVFTPDSKDYVGYAQELVSTGQFHSGTFRTPGYPIFIAAPLAGGWQAVVAVQIAMDCGLIVLTFVAGRAMVSHKAGLVAAALQATSPLAIASSCRVLSDGLYAFMLMIVMLLLVRHFKLLREDVQRSLDAAGGEPGRRPALSGATWVSLIVAAIVLGLATYVRPVGQMMAVPIVLVLLWGKRGFARAAAFTAVFAVCLAPWIVRNIQTQNYYGFSSFASDSFVNYVGQAIFDETHGPNCGPKKSVLLRNAAEHPWLVAKYQLKGAPVFWLPAATDVLEIAGRTQGNKKTLQILVHEGFGAAVRNYFGDELNGGTIALLAVTLAQYLVWAAGLAMFLIFGLRYLWRSRLRMPPVVWIILLLVLLSMLVPGPANHPRFRVPLEPWLNIAAAAGILWLVQLRARGEMRS